RVRDVLAAGTLAADVTQTVKERLASQRASLVVERQELPCKISCPSPPCQPGAVEGAIPSKR
ncbi:MAG: hypothetical protein WBP56_26670, partial [Polyangia bacterium]